MHTRRHKRKQERAVFKSPNTVHVDNLPYDTTGPELKSALKFFGHISDLLIHRLSPQQLELDSPFTYAFVNFTSFEEAYRCRRSAIAIEIRGRKLRFNSRSENQQERFTLEVDQSIASTELDHSASIIFNVANMHNPEPHLRPRLNLRAPVDEIRGSTVLADKIPASWSASDFYYALVAAHIEGIVCVLIYQDEDERGFRQGLVQLKSEEEGHALCAQGTIHVNDTGLQIQHSEVKSIGLLKRRYTGRFSVFEPMEAPISQLPTCSVDNTDHLECFADASSALPPTRDGPSLSNDTFWDQTISGLPTQNQGGPSGGEVTTMMNRDREYSAFNELDLSPSDDIALDFTPASDFTPATDIYRDEKVTYAMPHHRVAPLGTINGSVFATFAPSHTYPYPPDGNVAPYGVMPMPLSVSLLPMVASSTLIIDNIEPKSKENAQSDLERISNKIGGVLSIDMAKNGGSYRAFICYQGPNEASASFPRLQKHYQGSPIQVRFA